MQHAVCVALYVLYKSESMHPTEWWQQPKQSLYHAMHLASVSACVQDGYDVLGGYMSPVNDAYGKPDLVGSHHR